ncbi:alpha/beta hydrolase [Luteimonas aestuarii]|uniref:alpha/beta hydrolase n=1 Tax=Luteimonas aestuarii TaxID=453837 RepID=UPI001404A585|nr:alpha/beta fold hydrolase [Luteimonas aestuarii]
MSRLHPASAVRLFDRIWFTAPRTRPRPDARHWLPRGERKTHRVHGREVVSWSWGAGPTVLLLHGWGGHGAQMHAFVPPLLEAGFRVVMFDAPAHGASGPSRLGGNRVTFIEIVDALRVVAASTGPLAGLIAHSGGCAVAALALRDGWQGPRRMTFVAPFALPSAAIEPFASTVGASAAVAAAFREQAERRLARAWEDFDIPALPGVRELPPLLVVHDREDREVPFFNGETVASAWPGANLLATDGLGHRRLLRDPGTVARIVGFMMPEASVTRGVPADARGELDHDYARSGLSHARC